MKNPKKVPKIDLEAIDAVLKRDAQACLLVENIFLDTTDEDSVPPCDNMGRCANGALLLEAGFSPKKLVGMSTFSAMTGESAHVLKEAYGLLPAHIRAIITTNDATNCTVDGPQLERYEEVMALLEFAQWMQENGVHFSEGRDLRTAYREAFFFYNY